MSFFEIAGIITAVLMVAAFVLLVWAASSKAKFTPSKAWFDDEH